MRYVEVTNAQHFEAFLPFPDYAANFIPLHVYFIQALNLMRDHRNSGAALRPSQGVRTTTRGTQATPLDASMSLPLPANPAAGNRDGNTLVAPD